MMTRVPIAIAAWIVAASASAAAPLPSVPPVASISVLKTGGMGRADARLDAARSSIGLWTVNYEDRSDLTGPYRVTVVLTPKKAAALESLLKNSRLYSEPEKITPENHGVECLDGSNTTTEIEFEGHRRKVVAICLGNEGLTGQISALLFSSLPRRPCPTGITCISARPSDR